MNKKYLICLNCGNVQVRTDIDSIIKNKYTLIDKKIYCSRCETSTKQVATSNIKILKKSLIDSANNFDKQIYSLLSR